VNGKGFVVSAWNIIVKMENYPRVIFPRKLNDHTIGQLKNIYQLGIKVLSDNSIQVIQILSKKGVF
jgi:hypothetical protein